MAAWGKHARNTCSFSKQAFSLLKQSGTVTRTLTLTGNLKKSSTASSLFKALNGQDSILLKSMRKQFSKTEMRQIQRSAAILSLTSKINMCATLVASSDGEVVEGNDDDDVCSQPGHKAKKNRIIRI